MRESFSDALLSWYRKNKRDLPWRKNREFYPVYLSEVMLQQTRAKTVIPYYGRFLERFPDMESFAASSQEEYLKLWEGLGYYSRVRNFHSAISSVVSEGRIPDTKETLLSLKGVGEYTASILLAICFGKKEVAVDGNLYRIYSRFTEDSSDPKSVSARRDSREFFLSRMENSYGDFNQALMDLGEMICLPNGMPLCGGCPLRAFCKSYQDNTMLLYPPKSEKKEKTVEKKTVLLISYHNLFLIRKRRDKGLLASLYEYVLLDGFHKEEEVVSSLVEKGLSIRSISSLPLAKHVFSHKVWEMKGYRIDLQTKKALEGTFFASADEIRTKYALPSAFASFTSLLSSCRQPEVS